LSGSRKKIGIVATRKAGPATERNRVKRLIREYFRRNKGDFPQGSVVFVVGNAAAVRDNEELREELSAVVKRLRDKAENDGGRR
jgi:ribonuclease P protein component